MTTEQALAHCPFCGADAAVLDGKSDDVRVRCESCNVAGPVFYFDSDNYDQIDAAEAQAREAWNRRATLASEPASQPAAAVAAPKFDGMEVAPDIFLIGEPTHVEGSKYRSLANAHGSLALIEINIRPPLAAAPPASEAVDAVPPGWMLVPVEPPDLLLNSFLGGYGARGGSFNAAHLRDRARRGYKEMLESIEIGRTRGIEALKLPSPAPVEPIGEVVIGENILGDGGKMQVIKWAKNAPPIVPGMKLYATPPAVDAVQATNRGMVQAVRQAVSALKRARMGDKPAPDAIYEASSYLEAALQASPVDAVQAGAMTADAERFNALQNMPVEQAQAFFWNYSSRKARAKAIDAAIRAARSAAAEGGE